MKYLVAFLIAVFSVIGINTTVSAQEILEQIPFMHFTDVNGNNEFDAGIDTHIRWGGFNYTVFAPDGTIIDSGTIWMINHDIIGVFLAQDEVVAFSRVGDCAMARVWANDNWDNEWVIIQWPEFDNSCQSPIEPIDPYRVYLPHTLNR